MENLTDKHEHLWREEDKWITWGTGGFGNGTLIRHCMCTYFESCDPKTYIFKVGKYGWSWDAGEIEKCRKAFRKIC